MKLPRRGIAKQSKAEVRYTDHGTDAEHCSICTHYIDPNACEVVSGRVVPGGWCKRFKKKS